MFKLSTRFWIIVILFFGVTCDQSMARDLQVNVIANPDLYSGVLSDGTELAVIYISHIGDNCILNVWGEFFNNGVRPGHYTLYNTQGGNSRLTVKLSGKGWQPDIQFGNGMILINPPTFTKVKLLSNGDQFVDSATWPIDISVKCRSKK